MYKRTDGCEWGNEVLDAKYIGCRMRDANANADAGVCMYIASKYMR